MNGKQYKHQKTLSYSSQFMVKRHASWMNFWISKEICAFVSPFSTSLPNNKVSSSIGNLLLISRLPIINVFFGTLHVYNWLMCCDVCD